MAHQTRAIERNIERHNQEANGHSRKERATDDIVVDTSEAMRAAEAKSSETKSAKKKSSSLSKRNAEEESTSMVSKIGNSIKTSVTGGYESFSEGCERAVQSIVPESLVSRIDSITPAWARPHVYPAIAVGSSSVLLTALANPASRKWLMRGAVVLGAVGIDWKALADRAVTSFQASDLDSDTEGADTAQDAELVS